MSKKYAAAGALLLALLGGAAVLYLRTAMPAAEVIRKLSGLRMALEFYRAEYRGFPDSYDRVVEAGNLETVPELKLAGHLKKREVRRVQAFELKDTGGWAYIGNRSDPRFGLVYIDCRHKDEKGRFWSEF